MMSFCVSGNHLFSSHCDQAKKKKKILKYVLPSGGDLSKSGKMCLIPSYNG